MRYGKVYIDKEHLKELLKIDPSIDLAIVGLTLDSDESVNIKFIVSDEISIPTSNDSSFVRRVRLL